MTKCLFVTYAWDDNREGDISFVFQELHKAGLKVEFDQVSFTSGRRLWEQIGEKIASSDIDAWAYMVTRASLNSQACLEEYYLALGRALQTRGGAFPLIPLVHGVPFSELPPSLHIRLGVPLDSPNWVEQVVAGVEGRTPRIPQEERAPIAHQWHVGPDGRCYLEVRPRLATIHNWRVGIPLAFRASVTNHQVAPSGAVPASSANYMTVDDENAQYRVVGSLGPIGGGMSAYLTIEGQPPDHVVVGGQGTPDYRVSLP